MGGGTGAERSAEGAVLACGVCCGGRGRLGRRVKAKEGAERRRKCDLRVFVAKICPQAAARR